MTNDLRLTLHNRAFFGTVLRQLRKPVETSGNLPSGGTFSSISYEPNGIEEVSYRVEFDVRAIESLAKKAAGNKSGKSRLGPITVRVNSRRKAVANA